MILKPILRVFFRRFLYFIIGCLVFSFVWVSLYRWVNPPITALMIKRKFTCENKDCSLKYSWRSYSDISPLLFRSFVAAEDQKFFTHYGFDFESMQKAWSNNKKGKRIKGGSTISQQTAKNVFLWEGRNYLRKILEAYFTVLIELLWSKERILEVYANVVETGILTFGAEEGAQRYFYKGCKNLTSSEAALLAATLPNPRKYNPRNPSPYLLKRVAFIKRQLPYVMLNQ